jgi:hypothetical protein
MLGAMHTLKMSPLETRIISTVRTLMALSTTLAVRCRFTSVYSTNSNLTTSEFHGPDSAASSWSVGSMLLINGINKVVI